MFEYARFDPANPEYARCDALAHNAVDSEVDKADEELVPITREVIEAGRSERGGWNKEQLACLGVTWPPQRGWKDTVEGRFIKRADLNRFLLLKSEHGSSEVARGLFEYESNDDDSQQD